MTLRRTAKSLERTQRDLDQAHAQVAALVQTNRDLRRIIGVRDYAYDRLADGIKTVLADVRSHDGASLEDVCERLDQIITRATLTRGLHAVAEGHEPADALPAIQARTAGGQR